MLVELTARSAEIIAREQAEHGAVSPEHLIEQALEAFEHRLDSQCGSMPIQRNVAASSKRV